jgi:hypothetical protein
MAKKKAAEGAARSNGSTIPRKAQATFNLPVPVLERARDAVFWSPGWTMARLAERGLELAIAELENKRGGGFPPREDEALPAGRPVERRRSA